MVLWKSKFYVILYGMLIEKMHSIKKSIRRKDVLKLIFATIIFYLGIFYFTKKAGEEIVYLAEN